MSVNEWKKKCTACLNGFKGNHKSNNFHSHLINITIVHFNCLDYPFPYSEIKNYKPYNPPNLWVRCWSNLKAFSMSYNIMSYLSLALEFPCGQQNNNKKFKKITKMQEGILLDSERRGICTWCWKALVQCRLWFW